jgi:hypothetical protein
VGDLRRIAMISHSATAPEKIRTKVKVAASMAVSLSAARQSSELLANAILARKVSVKIRAEFRGSVCHRFETGKQFFCFGERTERDAIAHREKFIPHREYVWIFVGGIDRLPRFPF